MEERHFGLARRLISRQVPHTQAPSAFLAACRLVPTEPQDDYRDRNDHRDRKHPSCWASDTQADVQEVQPRLHVMASAVWGHSYTSRGAPPLVAPSGSRGRSRLMAPGWAHAGVGR